MNDSQYRQHCLDALADFAQTLSERTRQFPDDDPLRELARGFDGLVAAPEDLYATGQALVARFFTTYPELAPLFPRDLLWFMGGDALHLMADEEIAVYQNLDEERHAAAAQGQVFNIAEARAKRLKLQ